MATKAKKGEPAEMSVAEKLSALYQLQQVDSEIDKIKTLRGELPLEVQDLEDDIAGLETRIGNIEAEVNTLQESISKKNNEIINAQGLIKKYEEQQNNVRNNREFDSISKEMEFQTLEIELAEKRKKEFSEVVSSKELLINESKVVLEERQGDLTSKNGELNEIIEDNHATLREIAEESERFRMMLDGISSSG